jgi:hypothetical protein
VPLGHICSSLVYYQPLTRFVFVFAMSRNDIYERLPLRPQSFKRRGCYIRILHLASGAGDEPLSGELELVELAAKASQAYEALSFDEGTEAPASFLFVQQDAVPISSTLEAALLSLRLPDNPRALWVDVICTDQSNVEERRLQAQYIKHIYSRALRVVVWLGRRAPGLEPAFQLAHRIAEIQQIEAHQRALTDAPYDGDARALIWFSVLEGSTLEDLGHLRDVFRRPYFTRLWSLPSFVAASDGIFKSDDLEIAFEDVGPAFSVVARESEDAADDLTLQVWSEAWEAKRPVHSATKRSIKGSLGHIVQLLELTSSFRTVDDRDRIFALRGICDEGLDPILAIASGMPNQSLWRRILRRMHSWISGADNLIVSRLGEATIPAIMPDYSKSATDVYVDFTRFMILRPPGGLDILNYVVHSRDPDSDAYPSWAPQWSGPKDCKIMRGHFRAGIIKNKFPAAEVHDNPRKGPPQSSWLLSAEGFWVDNVETVSDVLELQTTAQESSIKAIERAWDQLFDFPLTPSSGKRYIDSQPLDVAFCTALSAGPLGNVAAGYDGLDNSSADQIVQHVIGYHLDEGVRPRAFLAYLQDYRVSKNSQGPPPSDAARFINSAVAYANSRRVFRTHGGRLGIGPKIMQPGDKVIILFGAALPFIVRQKDGYCNLIGQCYVADSSIMDGVVASSVFKKAAGPLGETFYLR